MSRKSTKRITPLTPDQQALITPELINYAGVMASHYNHCCSGALQPADLRQEALYGLCEAAVEFRPQQANTLSTFATFYIRKHILLAIEQYGTPMRLNAEDRETLRIVSIDAILIDRVCCPDDEAPLADIPDQPDDDLLYQRLETLLSALSLREQQIVRLIHGLDGEPLTMRQAADRLGVKPDRARQIYNCAIAKLQLAADNEL